MRNVLDLTNKRSRALSRAPIGGGGLIAPLTPTVNGTPARVRGITQRYLVTNVPTLILQSDFDRLFLEIDNNDTVGVVWCSFGVPNAVGVGFQLAPNGGGRIFDFSCPTEKLYLVGSIAVNNNVIITLA